MSKSTYWNIIIGFGFVTLLAGFLSVVIGLVWWGASVHYRIISIEMSVEVLDDKMDTLLGVNGVKVVRTKD